MRFTVLGLATTLLAACYATHPDIPTIKPPELKDDTKLDVESWVHDTHKFKINHRGDIVKDTYVEGEASYGGEKLTYAQAYALADPQGWSSKVSNLRDKHRACNRGRTFAVVGYGAMVIGGIGGMVAGLMHGDSQSDLTPTEQIVVVGAVGTFALGVASYLAGYAVGGYACSGEGDLRAEMRIDRTDTSLSASQVEEIEELAKRFNAQRKGAAPPRDEVSGR